MANRIETDQDKKDSERFVRGYLRPDGVFLMRLIGHNTNQITVTEVSLSVYFSVSLFVNERFVREYLKLPNETQSASLSL